MPDLAQLNIRINSLEAEVARRRLGDLSREAKSTQSSLGSLAGLSAVFGAVASAAAGLGRALQLSARFEQTQIAFETLLGSADAAKQRIQELTKFAAETPFQFEGLANATRLMLAMGFQADKTTKMLRTLGDATSALGGGEQMLSRIVVALGQMQAKGKVSAQEMNQLAEQGIGAWKFLAEAMGTSVKDAMKAAESGAISAADAIPAILAGMERDFAGSMGKQSKTLAGLFSTMKDTVELTLKEIGDEIVQALDLKQLLKDATAALESFGHVAIDVVRIFAGLPPKFRDTASTAQDVVTAIKAMGAAVAFLLTLKLIDWFRTLITLMAEFIAAVAANPFGLLAVAIAAAVAALVYFWDTLIDVEGEMVSVGSIATAAFEVIGKKLVLLVQMGVRWWQIWGDAIMDMVESVINSITSFISDVFSYVADAGLVVFTGMKLITNKIIALWVTVFEFIGKRLGAMANVVQRAMRIDFSSFEALQRTGGLFIESITDGLSPQAAWNELADSFVRNFERDFVGEAADGIASAFDELIARIKLHWSITMDDPEFKKLADEFQELGGFDLDKTINLILQRAKELQRAKNIRRDALTTLATGGNAVVPGAVGALPGIDLGTAEAKEILKLHEMMADLWAREADVGLSDFEKDRAEALRKYAEAAEEAYGRTQEYTDALENYGRMLDRVMRMEVLAENAKLFKGITEDIGLTGLHPDQAAIERQVLDMRESMRGLPQADVDAEVAKLRERLGSLHEAVRWSEFRLNIAEQFERGAADGLFAAIMDGDWQDMLHSLLMSIAQDSFRFAFSGLTSTQGGTSNIFFDAIGAVLPAAAGTAAGAEAAPRSMNVAVLMYPDEATADAMGKKMSSRGKSAIVAHGTGQPGVSSGRLQPRRRR